MLFLNSYGSHLGDYILAAMDKNTLQAFRSFALVLLLDLVLDIIPDYA